MTQMRDGTDATNDPKPEIMFSEENPHLHKDARRVESLFLLVVHTKLAGMVLVWALVLQARTTWDGA
eukprot:5015977-Amphidinium_carterae.1